MGCLLADVSYNMSVAKSLLIGEYQAPHVHDATGLPIFVIPMTAGSGSKATLSRIIAYQTTDGKMFCSGQAYLPTGALVDYELTLTTPPR